MMHGRQQPSNEQLWSIVKVKKGMIAFPVFHHMTREAAMAKAEDLNNRSWSSVYMLCKENNNA